ncbi:MAG TPA: alpha/beta fold hydrolase [Candidatus Binatia bacterium]|nr:alpha/beta fold hydrolase [Candidatus Binatia bacterium]
MTIALTLAGALLIAAAAGYFFFPDRAAAAFVAIGRAAARLRPRTVAIPGFEIAYLEGGRGEPLVLLHGIGGDKDNWTFVSLFLARRYRVIAWDAPGFGDSSCPPGASYGVDAQVDRLHAFLQSLGIGRAHFGGNSMGGLIASHYALRYPHAVESLWLLNTAYVASAKPSEGFARIERGEANPLFARSEAEFAALVRFIMERPPFIPAPMRRVLAAKQAACYARNLEIFEELRASIVPLEESVAGLSIPTLIVWGDCDRVFDCSSAEILHRVMPRSRMIVMPRIGHVPMIEAPLRAARDYLAFRAELAPERAPQPTSRSTPSPASPDQLSSTK